MPRQERNKTKYPGVYFIESDGAKGKERIFYICYRRDGKQIEEKAGYQYADDMTEAKANAIRSDRIRGRSFQTSNGAKQRRQRNLKRPEDGRSAAFGTNTKSINQFRPIRAMPRIK